MKLEELFVRWRLEGKSITERTLYETKDRGSEQRYSVHEMTIKGVIGYTKIIYKRVGEKRFALLHADIIHEFADVNVAFVRGADLPALRDYT